MVCLAFLLPKVVEDQENMEYLVRKSVEALVDR
jgi:hypothetical protein